MRRATGAERVALRSRCGARCAAQRTGGHVSTWHHKSSDG